MRATIAVSLNSARDDYGKPPTAVHFGQRRHRSSQPPNDAVSDCWLPSPQEQTAIRFALALLRGKWKTGILCRLQEGPARLGDLRRLFPQASKKMLTQHLREMEQDGLIVRSDLSGKVPHVEYSLSDPRGRAVSQLLHILTTWSTGYSAYVLACDGNEFSAAGKIDPRSEAVLKDRSHAHPPKH